MASKAAVVSANKRSELGSRANKRLRDSGKLPGVIYGHKQDVVPITLNRKEVTTHLTHGAHLFELALDGGKENALVKEVQYDHLGIEVLHVDFARVDLNERVELTVSLELKGEPKGEKDGGVLQQIVNELEIECVVTDIPDIIVHDVTEMGMDSVLYIKDLKLPPGVKCTQDEDLMVAQVREVKEQVAAATEEAAAEPEVIGGKKPEDDAAAAAAAPAKK
ncbi:MAG TPA: 50S ribosomal protein L25 [Tepidisphaeraceae bacterium]|nr:50S ribosomal protein L25 [Tepidisphaeraceae bacterium]